MPNRTHVKIGIIAEGNDADVIEEILGKYLAKNQYAVKRHGNCGCGTLRNKCKAWAKMLSRSGYKHILLFHDLDGKDEITLREELTAKVSLNDYPNSIIVIPVQEIEAWLLTDEKAIKKVFNLKTIPPHISNCETIQSPKEHLRNLVRKLGEGKHYLHNIHNKKIAEAATITNFRRCESYRKFDKYIKNNICT